MVEERNVNKLQKEEEVVGDSNLQKEEEAVDDKLQKEEEEEADDDLLQKEEEEVDDDKLQKEDADDANKKHEHTFTIYTAGPSSASRGASPLSKVLYVLYNMYCTKVRNRAKK